MTKTEQAPPPEASKGSPMDALTSLLNASTGIGPDDAKGVAMAMTNDLTKVMDIKTVAAMTLIEAYGELKTKGQLSGPGITAAAYAEIKALLEFLERRGVADESYDGANVKELIETAEDHGDPCGCMWCFRAGPQ